MVQRTGSHCRCTRATCPHAVRARCIVPCAVCSVDANVQVGQGYVLKKKSKPEHNGNSCQHDGQIRGA